MGDRAIICGRCGAENEADATFCAQCGALLSAYEAPDADGADDAPAPPDPDAAAYPSGAPGTSPHLTDWEALFPGSSPLPALGATGREPGAAGDGAGAGQSAADWGWSGPEGRPEHGGAPPSGARLGASPPRLPPARGDHPLHGEWTTGPPSLEANARAVILVGIVLVLLACLWFVVALVTSLRLWISLACLLPLGIVLLAVGIVMLLVAPKRRGDRGIGG